MARRSPKKAEMIEGAAQLYQDIAQSMVQAIPEDWSSAKFEAIFFDNASVFEAEYTRKDGKVRDFLPLSSGPDALERLRELFKEAGKQLWGQVCFELRPNGQFNITFGYDNCDANGDTIFDEDQEVERSEARRRRLTQP
jgi:hypothetical protein